MPEPLDAPAVTVCARCTPLIESRRHPLSLDLGGQAQSIFGDEPSLRRLFWILLDDAIKYAPPGGKIGVSLDQSDNQPRVTLTDSGICIPGAALPHIFDRFYRADASRGCEEGTGLGRAIAKWIADIHHAALTAKSVEGCGTTFQALFPPAA